MTGTGKGPLWYSKGKPESSERRYMRLVLLGLKGLALEYSFCCFVGLGGDIFWGAGNDLYMVDDN